jgi:hypothetical protein
LQDRDLTLAGVVLTGGRITIADTSIEEMLPGVRIALAPFLLLIPAVPVISSATLTVFSMPGNPPGRKKA